MPRGVPGSGGSKYGITIAANVKGTQNIKRLGNSMQGVQGRAKNLAGSLKGLVGPLLAIGGAAAVFGTLRKSFQVLAEREADFATLANGLSRVSTDAPKAAKALRGMADELGFKTLFDEKAFQKGFSLLTSFKNIGLDSYGRVAETAADLAQINQVDLKSSFLQLAKALSDPTRGLTALSRSGVIFTEEQRKMILALHESGQEMKAQAEILRIVEGSYKGAARAAATGLAGAFDTLGQKVRDFNEAFGGAAEPFMEPLVRATTEVFDVVTDGLNLISDDMVVFAKNIEIALGPVFKWIIENLKNMFKWMDQVFATQRNLATIQVKTGDQFKKVRNSLLLDAKGIDERTGLYTANTKAIDRAKEKAGVFTEEDFKGVWRPRKDLLGKAKDFKPFLQEAINEIFQENIEAYVEKELGLKAIKPKIEEVTLSLEGNIQKLNGLKTSADGVKESFREAFGKDVKGKLDAFTNSMKTVGESMGDIFVKSIKGMEDALVNFVMTGKLSFKSLANSIIADMARIAIQQAITAPLTGWFKGLFSAKGNAFSGGQHLTAYAKGGVIDSPHYKYMANGGIAVAGEGSGAEAILPLKRGRNGILGVEGGGNSTSISVSVDATGSKVEGDEPNARELGNLIAAAIQSELIKQKRNGGLLAPA
jgi:hypothetical protein